MKKIGLSDRLDFPELGLSDISVKIDTGAYTSSIHCHEIDSFEEDGVKKVSFCLLDPEHEDYCRNKITKEIYKIRRVKSSNGQIEKRFSIKSKVRIYNRLYSIELTLTDRSDMKFPVLLGRKLLSGKFLVDVSKKNLSHDMKKGEL